MEYTENDEDLWVDFDGSHMDAKVRRQISDCCEYDSKIVSNKVSPNDKIEGNSELRANLSQNYYQNFLNQLKDDEPKNIKVKTSLGMARVETDFRPSNSSPNSHFEGGVQSSKTVKAKKNSFLKVEEFRKSKKFRESKIPTNTSLSGIDKNQYQTNKNKSFDLINYQGKRKSKF